MFIIKIIQNPLIKILGISLILYYGLLSVKDHPDSLGNRITKERITKNISDMKNKGQFIAVNVKKAKEYAAKKEIEEKNQDIKTKKTIKEECENNTNNIDNNKNNLCK